MSLRAVIAALALFASTSLATPVDSEALAGSTTVLAPVSIPTAPVAVNGSCSDDGSRDFSCPVDGSDAIFKAANCADFEIECGVDRVGGDLPDSPQYPGSFAGCVDVCAGMDKCMAVVYSGGPCYLKAELAATAELAGATGAKKAAQASASSSVVVVTAAASSSSSVEVVWTTVTATAPSQESVV